MTSSFSFKVFLVLVEEPVKTIILTDENNFLTLQEIKELDNEITEKKISSNIKYFVVCKNKKKFKEYSLSKNCFIIDSLKQENELGVCSSFNIIKDLFDSQFTVTIQKLVVKSIEKGFYKDLVKHKIVDYSSPQYKELKKDFFIGFTVLEKIEIHGVEKLVSLDENVFDSVSSTLQELKIIYCNRVETLSSRLLHNLSNLKIFTVHLNSKLKGFPTDFFESEKLENLESLTISHNSKIIELSSSLKNCTNLRYLNISYNKLLKSISHNFITPSIKELILRQPKLIIKCSDTINTLKKIENVVCYENLLKKVSTKETVQKMKFLKECIEEIKKMDWAKGFDVSDEEVLKELREDNYFRKGTIYEATEQEMKNAVLLYNI